MCILVSTCFAAHCRFLSLSHMIYVCIFIYLYVYKREHIYVYTCVYMYTSYIL